MEPKPAAERGATVRLTVQVRPYFSRLVLPARAYEMATTWALAMAMQCTPADVAREALADAAVLAGPNPWLVADADLPALCSSFPLGALTLLSPDSAQCMRDALVARHAVAHARQALRHSAKVAMVEEVGPSALELPDTPMVVSLGCVTHTTSSLNATTTSCSHSMCVCGFPPTRSSLALQAHGPLFHSESHGAVARARGIRRPSRVARLQYIHSSVLLARSFLTASRITLAGTARVYSGSDPCNPRTLYSCRLSCTQYNWCSDK